jgi:hypothetical protein
MEMNLASEHNTELESQNSMMFSVEIEAKIIIINLRNFFAFNYQSKLVEDTNRKLEKRRTTRKIVLKIE